MAYSRTHKDNLKQLKKHVETWHQYFKRNHQRFWDYTKFCCATSISNKERAALQAVSKPQLEFNILEAQVSRLRGEFAKHSPSFEIRAADGVPINTLTPDFIATMDVIEGHLLAMFGDNTNDSLKYKFYSDLLIGGFSVGEIRTQYVNERSFEQKIIVERVFDPTLTVFDPMARLSHKGDGMFCGKLVPMTAEDFKEQFPGHDISEYKFGVSTGIDGFNWSYENQQQDIILVADLFVKKHKKTRIVKLSNGHVVPLKHYEQLAQIWDEQQVMAVLPKILDERDSMFETICRYKFCDSGVLAFTETDFTHFPLVFLDGNSVLIHGQDINSGTDANAQNGSDSDNSGTSQMCRPYILHARDMQLLMNFAGQSLAGEMENIVQHQYIVAVESIPEDQEAAYTQPQIASCLQYNAIFDKETNTPLPPPQVLQRRQIPPELANTFNGASQMMQIILGNYDATLGINDKQISGVAIQQGAMQSNAAALPYFMGFTNGLNRLAEIVVDLIPKYYRTPRTIPVIRPDGKHDYQMVNNKGEQNSIMLDYDPKSLQVKVEMGTSAEVQKQVAIDQITALMPACPQFADFIGNKCVGILIDNMSMRGVDHMKELYGEWQQELEAAKNQPPPPTDTQIIAEAEIQKTQMETDVARERIQVEGQNKAADLAIKQQEVELKFAELMAKIQSDEVKNAIASEKASSENSVKAVELGIRMIKDLSGNED
jgi:hypothetical protein